MFITFLFSRIFRPVQKDTRSFFRVIYVNFHKHSSAQTYSPLVPYYDEHVMRYGYYIRLDRR